MVKGNRLRSQKPLSGSGISQTVVLWDFERSIVYEQVAHCGLLQCNSETSKSGGSWAQTGTLGKTCQLRSCLLLPVVLAGRARLSLKKTSDGLGSISTV